MMAQDPSHFRLGQGGEERLANARAVQRDANSRRGRGAHHLTALDLREEARLAAIEDREIDGLTAFLHEAAHARPGDFEKITRLDEGAPDDKGLHADRPVSRPGWQRT